MTNHENKHPVTLEDLLRLKRAERPSAEFWTQFDRELRAKQLAAIVEKRPWWSSVPRVLAGLSRYHVPLGATAVLALTIVSVREFRPSASLTAPRQTESAGAVAVAEPVTSASTANAVTGDVVSEIGSPMAPVEDRMAESRPTALAVNSDAAPSTESTVSSRVKERTAQTASLKLGSDLAGLEPQSMATNLVALRGGEAAFARDLLGAPRGFETRALPASKPKIDPLMQMTSPSVSHRSSLLNASFTGNAVATSLRSTPSRSTRRMSVSDEQLYDTASRFVASGNTLGAKF